MAAEEVDGVLEWEDREETREVVPVAEEAVVRAAAETSNHLHLKVNLYSLDSN